MLKLNLACGSNYMNGWQNVDINPAVKADQYLDLTQKLPLEDGSVDYIFVEHFNEHLTQEQGKSFLKECHRILKPNGVLRIAMPDLQYVVDKYLEKEYGWKNQPWLNDSSIPEGMACKTAAEMLNLALRGWKHQFLYDAETLCLYLEECGFWLSKTTQESYGVSYHRELRKLETRIDSRLIMEAMK